jgi:hypothetical protein
VKRLKLIKFSQAMGSVIIWLILSPEHPEYHFYPFFPRFMSWSELASNENVVFATLETRLWKRQLYNSGYLIVILFDIVILFEYFYTGDRIGNYSLVYLTGENMYGIGPFSIFCRASSDISHIQGFQKHAPFLRRHALPMPYHSCQFLVSHAYFVFVSFEGLRCGLDEFVGRDAEIGLSPGFPCALIEVRMDHRRDELEYFYKSAFQLLPE